MSKTLCGKLQLPGDKSISHRALMLLGIAHGAGRIENLSLGQDVMSTMACMKALGVSIQQCGEFDYLVEGVDTLQSPPSALDCGNSGTTIRLLSGIVCGANLDALLSGDESLQKRPMKRVTEPLSLMGANITATGEAQCAPLKVQRVAEGLHGMHYTLPMASAQVKSAILLAGLFTPDNQTLKITEPLASRDHTERMLTALGAPVCYEQDVMTLVGRKQNLISQNIFVPGDISSAAFWLVGAAILPGSELRLEKISLNPSRLGILEIFQRLGADLTIENENTSVGEPYGDLFIRGSQLKGDITILPEHVPALIDEIPILTILGLFTEGTFTVRGAEELRFKESDRLASLVRLLETLCVPVESYADGFSFQGHSSWTVPVITTPFETHHDHRLVMALEILNLRAKTPLTILGKEWVAISYPTFFETLTRLIQTMV